ncbi:hypothetical protein RHGRI_019249 [Rhododendron griersonianum]|uniref:B box-type domain-containing protein n=2 Tax=Rhododendron TaxID=4346 RepID=A0AAV6JGB1_9ERIC
MLESSNLPRWLGALLGEKFFNACIIHEDSKKNEKNIFCLDCCEGICPHCLSPHRSHRLLQIRRYVYHDVIRVGDAEKLMDCSFVQLQHILSTDPTRISDYIFNCEHLTLPEPGLDDGQMTPESVLEPAGSLRTSSGSSGAGGIGCLTLGCTATTEVVVRKKRSNVSGFRPPFAPVSEISAGLLSRRKGTPQRSPLH